MVHLCSPGISVVVVELNGEVELVETDDRELVVLVYLLDDRKLLVLVYLLVLVDATVIVVVG